MRAWDGLSHTLGIVFASLELVRLRSLPVGTPGTFPSSRHSTGSSTDVRLWGQGETCGTFACHVQGRLSARSSLSSSCKACLLLVSVRVILSVEGKRFGMDSKTRCGQQEGRDVGLDPNMPADLGKHEGLGIMTTLGI